MLGIPADEVDTLIEETTGEGLFNLAEEDKVRKILGKYKPGGSSAVVPMLVNGTRYDVPREELEEFRKAYPSAREM